MPAAIIHSVLLSLSLRQTGLLVSFMQAADVCTSWRQQLDRAAPSSIAALLVVSQKRYDRLQQLTQAGLHEGTSLQYIMRLTDTRYAQVFGPQLEAASNKDA